MDSVEAPDSCNRSGDQENAGAAMQEVRSIEQPASAGTEIPEIVLTKALWRQIRSLQETEKEVQERLERQRVQQLVDKVEDEVEYEGILDDVCSRIRAEEDSLEVERREREWELERREEELEEQVEVLKDKVRNLEEELKMAQLGSMPGIQQMFYEDGERALTLENAVPKDIEVLDGGDGCKPSPSPTHEILLAFEDMLKEADERHEREKKALEDTIFEKEKTERKLRHERYEWRARLKQMESQMLAMEKEIGRLSGWLKERDSSVSMEKERRQACEAEAVKFLSLLKDERLAHKVVVVKLKKVESFLNKLKDRIAKEHEKNPNNSFLKELEKDVGRLSAFFSVKKDLQKSMEDDQFEALRKQRDAAVSERDKLEEKFSRLLKRSRDREAEIDAMWLEREKLLIDKMTFLEEQTERYAEDIAVEKKRWTETGEGFRKDWNDEKCALEKAIHDRDIWLKERKEETEQLLKEKDTELLTLKAVHQRLLHDLALYKKDERSEDLPQTCPGHSDEQSLPKYEIGPDERAEEVKGMLEKEETKDESLGTKQQQSSQRIELEGKVFETLSLVEELKSKMNEKESQMEWERKQMEALIAEGKIEVETMKRQLESKELEMEAQVEKFRHEMEFMEQELESEREKRSKVTADVQQRTNEMMKELSALRLEVRRKKEELENLTREKWMAETRFTKENDKLLAIRRQLEDEVLRLQRDNVELSFAMTSQEDSLDSEQQLEDTTSSSQSFDDKRHAEWQLALQKVAVFDKQISDAMLAIQNLREELSVKEAELQKARTEPELELERREEAWMKEQERQEAAYAQKLDAWKKTEQSILVEKKELSKLLETERSESSDAIALLNGIVRELQWALMRRAPDENVEHLIKSANKGDMVKVHASHWKEVDEYIGELKRKLEELERSKVKKLTREEELDEALVQVEKEMFTASPDRRSRLIKYGSPLSTRSRSMEQNLHIATLQPGTSTDRSWNLGGPLSCVSRDANRIEDRWIAQELPAQDILALVAPPRHQKKWLVDTSWLDQVRKEYSILTQQLAIERQRVAAFGQIEAENHWLEAMMLRALEQKKECELKLSQLSQRKI